MTPERHKQISDLFGAERKHGNQRVVGAVLVFQDRRFQLSVAEPPTFHRASGQQKVRVRGVSEIGGFPRHPLEVYNRKAGWVGAAYFFMPITLA